MIKAALKACLAIIYPEALSITHARGMRRDFKRQFHSRQIRNKGQIYGGEPPKVLTGPFKGLKYLDEIVWGPIEPKWLGTYEHELHPIFERILNTPYRMIIDVGSAEGYYSVGLATKIPDAKILSFDVDPWARRQQARLAQLNHVENITIGKYCSWTDLNEALQAGGLVVCDIEGHEYQLLDPSKATALRKADILVELHPSPDGRMSVQDGASALSSRFASTHEIALIPYNFEDKISRFTNGDFGLHGSDLLEALNELRPSEQVWLWCRAASNKRPAEAEGI